MPIVTHLDFDKAGPLYIPRVLDIAPILDEKLELFEQEQAEKLFGPAFYANFLLDYQTNFPLNAMEPRWQAFLDGVGVYENTARYEGYKGICGFLFFHLIRDGLTNMSENAVTVQTHENSHNTLSNKRLAPAWNMGVEWFKRASKWLQTRSGDYPELVLGAVPDKMNFYNI